MKTKSIFLPLFLFAILLLINVGCSEDKDNDFYSTDITYNDLPSDAKDFIIDFYSYTTVTKVSKIYADGENMYEVDFADGSEVVFNSLGVWQEVDAPDGKTIPDGIAPQFIVDYVNENYSDYGINEINKTGYGYNVELITGLDLMFSSDGQFLGYDS